MMAPFLRCNRLIFECVPIFSDKHTTAMLVAASEQPRSARKQSRLVLFELWHVAFI